MVVAGFRAPIARDFAAFVRRETSSQAILVAESGTLAVDEANSRPSSIEECLNSKPEDWGGHAPTSLMLFLPAAMREADRRGLTDLLSAASRWPIRFVGIVSSFRVHLDDTGAEETERLAVDLVRSSGLNSRVVLFRHALVLSPNSAAGRWVRRLGPLFPLAPRRLHTCFIDGDDFFAAIESERSQDNQTAGIYDWDTDLEEGADPARAARDSGRRQRAYTFLGANLAWRQVLERHRGATPGARFLTAVANVLSYLLIGQVIAIVVAMLAKWTSWARSLVVHTLKPRSMSELLALCHLGNIDFVRVVGYNNGVNHFGHRYPGKTIVATGRLHRTAHADPGILKADCGATIRDAKDYLLEHGEDLYVVPNYSYVASGTAFFVPIHGSAVDYSTVADTACRVVLYDPDRDQIVSATREEPAFRENVYNPRSRAVLLQLYLRIKAKSSYFVRRETRNNAGAEELLAALRDSEAANVEIRQAHAASDKVTIAKYYTSPGDPSEPALESPRDSLGRLWDQLEENPITSYLMHALSRHLAWHTELFFTPSEFEVFWRTHAQVPLRKIQLRYIRRDGMPNSPFRDEDCVSADLFLFRFDKPAFDSYLERTFATVRTNPGKHSN